MHAQEVRKHFYKLVLHDTPYWACAPVPLYSQHFTPIVHYSNNHQLQLERDSSNNHTVITSIDITQDTIATFSVYLTFSKITLQRQKVFSPLKLYSMLEHSNLSNVKHSLLMVP